LFEGASPGARQLNFIKGLKPLKGKNPKLTLFAGNVAMPFAPTSTAAGDVATSQWSIGFQPAVDDGTPSHCSMLTLEFPAA
jgi:hypothetical protein